MDNKTQKQLAREFIKDNGIGRDVFIYILQYFEANPESIYFEYFYNGSNRSCYRQDWMEDIPNKRKLYEEVVNEQVEEIKDELQDSNASENDDEPDKDELKLLKKIYSLQQKNRRLNKQIHGNFKDIDKSEDLWAKFNNALPTIVFNPPQVKNKDIKRNKVGIITLADWHLNNLINQFDNKFDIKIASKRIKYFIDTTIKHFLDNDVETVYVFGLGDFCKSLRRDSEKLNTATSRANISMVAVKLIGNIFEDLSKYFYIKFAGVIGNESRLLDDLELNKIDASENMDNIIYEVLKRIYSINGHIKFIDTDLVNGIVHIEELNKNILIIHGMSISQSHRQKNIQELLGKYASLGITIDYVFYGHWHNASVGDKSSSSGSLCGSDSFSGITLVYDGRASQNCYIMYENGAVDGLKIDLQDINCYNGYDIENEIERFSIRLVNNGK